MILYGTCFFFLRQVIVFIFFLSLGVCLAANILEPGESLNTSSSLAIDNRCVLGLRRIGTTEFNGSYLVLGRSVGFKSMFWVGNRGKPIADDSGVLSIDESGTTMKLNSSDGEVVDFYTSARSSGGGLVAVLQSTCNFVLENRNGGSQTGNVVWASFDHPTDSLLPGMKLGVDSITGKKTYLVSWTSKRDPSPGPFTMEWNSTSRRLVIRRRGVPFWANATANIFDNAFSSTVSIVSTAVKDYFAYKIGYNLADYFLFLRLSYDGILEFHNGEETESIICDGNTEEKGCLRWERPACRSKEQRFELKTGLFTGSSYSDYNSSLSISDCKEICWRNCSCNGTGSLSLNGLGCIFYSGSFYPDFTGTYEQVNVILQKQHSRGSSSSFKYWVSLLAVVAIGLIMAIAFILLRLRKRRNKERLLNQLMALDTEEHGENLSGTDENSEDQSFEVYSVSPIMAATNSFSSENKLGQGGFGPVYYGKLQDGKEIAVKRLSRRSGQGMKEFKNEIALIAKLQHRNLVKLLGCCIHGDERMLIYEYMPNKSLDSFIFDESKKKILDWRKRFQIIEGIAQGILYLHKYSRLRIIHRDLKPGNILLDENMNPKISDLGMARIFKGNAEERKTRVVVGTYGYMSPEYGMDGIFSVKSDVYSFGVIMLEIVSGRKCNSVVEDLTLVEHSWKLWKEDNVMDVMDPTLREMVVDENQVMRCIHVGLLCVEAKPFERPTMSDVVAMLGREGGQLPLPRQPAFTSSDEAILSFETTISQQSNHSAG